jgi:hypothetical protein
MFADDEDILRQMEATSPQAALLVDLLRKRHRRGRPQIPERHYRQLMLWWKSFQRRHGDIPLATALAKFQHQHSNQIARLLGIKRGRNFRGTRGQNPNSFLNAVARGANEHDRIRQRRRSTWVMLGLRPRLTIAEDQAQAAYLRAAGEAAFLGKDPLSLFTFNSPLFK